MQTNFLNPQYAVRDMEIWMQCYYRWMPVLEIKNGGNIQIDLFNRMTLSSISKLQHDLQLRTFDEPASTTTPHADVHFLSNMPLISSFFPFTRNTTNSNELSDILTISNELLTEGSIFDGLSVQQGQE